MQMLKQIQNQQRMQFHQQQQLQMQKQQQMQQGQRPAQAPPHPFFTPGQLAALRYQIHAYRSISSNETLQPHVLQGVLAPLETKYLPTLATTAMPAPLTPTTPSSAPLASATVTTPSSNTNPAAVPSTPSAQSTVTSPVVMPLKSNVGSSPAAVTPPPPPVPEKAYTAYASPYHLLKKPISSYAHASRQQHMLIPSITPVSLDPQSFTVEKENRLQARIASRQTVLERQLKSLAKHDQLKPMIEFKALRLLEKQQKLRQEFVQGMTRGAMVATTVDRLAYRKMKKLTLREARTTESIERQQRLDREQKEKQVHLDHLQKICDHGRNLVSVQRNWQARQSKLGRAVIQLHQHIEKEEQKKAERISKERLKALKNDDEDAYMKLIDEAKDTRLTQLLKQTGSFLESLTRAVLDQQSDHREFLADTTVDEDDENSAVDPDTKLDYFKVTHRVKEEVQQPSILVGGKLKDYQIKGLQWMVSLYNNHLNGILADEMGLGKTIQTISLITYLIEFKKQHGPYLIIVPLSTLTNWTLEFEKWAPSVSKIVYKGTPQTRRQLQFEIRQGGFQVLLTTFEYILKDRPILSKIKWVHLIIDEGHRMKNTNSKLTFALRTYYNTRYRLILTGTPLQNSLPELWSILNFILPKIFKSVKTFEEWFNTPFSNQGVQDRIELNEEEQLLIIKRLHKVLRPFLLRRLKKDVESELPDKVERVIKCKFSALQSRLYNQMKKHRLLFASAANNDKGKQNIKGLNNTLMQLRKICNHPFVFEGVESTVNPSRQNNEMLYRTSGKFELLDRMLPKLRETGHRVLMFFQMTQIMSIMEDFLNYRGYAYLRLDGSTKADDRSQLLHLFNAPDSPYFIFLLSTRAGGLGLNLQTADTVIIFDSDWNPHQDLQAQDRAHRIGQTKEVRIFRLISANSVEENILARANYKLDIDGKVIQAGKFDNRSTDEDREAFLRTLLEDKADEDSDLDEELDDEELNDILKRSDQELAIFKRIDSERNRTEMEMLKRMGGAQGKKTDRLIQDDELPDIYRDEAVMANDMQNLIEYGRGQRPRSEVQYDDGLTEEQFIEALEDDSMSLQEAIARRHELNKRTSYSNSDDSDSSSTKPSSKKRGRPGRPKKGGGVRTGALVAAANAAAGRPVKRNKGYSGPDLVPPPIRAQMTGIFEQVLREVESAIVGDEHTYRQRAQLFMELVSKKEYPIYYTMIKNPIAISVIKKRMHSPYYKAVQQFRADFDLMFDNARIFNEEGSFVYEDANELQKIVHAKLQQLCPGGLLPPLDMMAAQFGQETIHFQMDDDVDGDLEEDE
ncbi:hypothetical protein DM01DRAFT_1361823 [Hesseltinella vesiculosa]|uniref:SNF2-family ATP dependent chromatin remodeling factor snf21 n=1 Tax=Hesseltinella vesiculosa TaxID=101127 RepID=A0A1X2GPN0_9FUNG|nr:hypothetical protein DM01DRAFT_1361823 [Hesseltinella vesiculosa]